MKTFHCSFDHGISCTLKVSAAPPASGAAHLLGTEWVGQPTKAVLEPYKAWINTVNQQLADEWGVRIMHVFLLGPTTFESWEYIPGSKPSLLRR